MPLAYIIGIQWGTMGLVHAWQIAAPILLVATLTLTLPVIGAGWGALIRTMIPVAVASATMAVVLILARPLVVALSPSGQLAVLVAIGVSVYALTLWLAWPSLVKQVIGFVVRRTPPVAAAPETDPVNLRQPSRMGIDSF